MVDDPVSLVNVFVWKHWTKYTPSIIDLFQRDELLLLIRIIELIFLLSVFDCLPDEVSKLICDWNASE